MQHTSQHGHFGGVGETRAFLLLSIPAFSPCPPVGCRDRGTDQMSPTSLCPVPQLQLLLSSLQGEPAGGSSIISPLPQPSDASLTFVPLAQGKPHHFVRLSWTWHQAPRRAQGRTTLLQGTVAWARHPRQGWSQSLPMCKMMREKGLV